MKNKPDDLFFNRQFCAEAQNCCDRRGEITCVISPRGLSVENGIWQVGGPSLTHFFDATVYLVKGKDEYILIDCGTPEGYEQIKENIRKAGVDPARITKIFGTHGHYDHVGAAYLWKEEFGTRLYLHELDREQVEKGDAEKTSASLLYGKDFTPCAVDGLLQEGDRYEADGLLLEVLYTPGHTMGSVSFDVTADGYRLLIAGDAVWGGFSEKIGSDEAAWRQTLQKITARHYDFYTFGHVNPQLIADADARLREAQMAFANYYNPWFKTFYETYRY